MSANLGTKNPHCKSTAMAVDRCSQCSYEFEHKFRAEHHVQRVHRNVYAAELFHAIMEPEQFPCSCCEFKSYYKWDLIQHCKVEHSTWIGEVESFSFCDEEIDDYRCDYCRFKSTSSLLLVKHIDSCSTIGRRSASAPHSDAVDLVPVVAAHKRKLDARKRNCCFYCRNVYTNIARHLEYVHKEEEIVLKFSILPKGSRARRTMLDMIRKKGNFELKKRVDQLIPTRQQKNAENSTKVDKYVPCPIRRGFYSECSLRRHYSIFKRIPVVVLSPLKNIPLALPSAPRSAPKPGTSDMLMEMPQKSDLEQEKPAGDERDDSDFESKTSQNVPFQTVFTRKAWTTEEKTIVTNLFRTSLESGKLPKFIACIEAVAGYPELNERTAKQLYAFLSNQIKKDASFQSTNRSGITRRTWSTAEKTAVRLLFKEDMDRHRLPPFRSVKKAVVQCEELKDRTAEQLYAYINNVNKSFQTTNNRAGIKRTAWSAAEKAAVRQIFKKELDDMRLPPFHLVQRVVVQCEELKNRTAEQLYAYINNENKKNKNKDTASQILDVDDESCFVFNPFMYY